MPQDKTPAAKNIWEKLMEIQKAIVTFAVSEESDKKAPSGKSEYKYTPGWEIIEKLRTFMDTKGLMLLPNCVSKENKLIEYPVYKNFNGKPLSFIKKEMYVEVTMEFTWLDTTTGEKAGPFISFGFGANGTDKSGATAMSMAERYFLLRFFHFTTREANEEPDAHDSGFIPGIGRAEQPQNLSPAQSVQAEQVPLPAYAPAPQAQPQPQPQYQPQYQPQPQPQYQGGPYQSVNPSPYIPQPVQAPQTGIQPKGFNPDDPGIKAVISQLSSFDKGTNSHKRVLNECLGRLAHSGYTVTDPNFVIALVEAGQAKRQGS